MIVATSAGWMAPAVAAAADRLPDLGMARLADFSVESTADGRRLLRYSTIIVNVGAGTFVARGSRPSTIFSEMSVSQRVFNDAGGWRDRPTTAKMFFAGDGHDHWHVRDLERAELRSLGLTFGLLGLGSKTRASAKHGFCFWDNYSYRLTLPGAPASAVYTSCGSAGALSVTMGLSVGWGDRYSHSLPNQYVDITGLGPGRYRLRVTADAANWFLESSEANNITWTDLELGSDGSVRVVGQGPAA